MTLDLETLRLLGVIQRETGAAKSEIIRRAVRAYFQQKASEAINSPVKAERKRAVTRKRS